MDPSNTAASASRRTEDIALDLLKFVAGHTNIKGATASVTTGFAAPSSSRPEDTVTQLLDLYARCRKAVESPLSSK